MASTTTTKTKLPAHVVFGAGDLGNNTNKGYDTEDSVSAFLSICRSYYTATGTTPHFDTGRAYPAANPGASEAWLGRMGVGSPSSWGAATIDTVHPASTPASTRRSARGGGGAASPAAASSSATARACSTTADVRMIAQDNRKCAATRAGGNFSSTRIPPAMVHKRSTSRLLLNSLSRSTPLVAMFP